MTSTEAITRFEATFERSRKTAFDELGAARSLPLTQRIGAVLGIFDPFRTRFWISLGLVCSVILFIPWPGVRLIIAWGLIGISGTAALTLLVVFSFELIRESRLYYADVWDRWGELIVDDYVRALATPDQVVYAYEMSLNERKQLGQHATKLVAIVLATLGLLKGKDWFNETVTAAAAGTPVLLALSLGLFAAVLIGAVYSPVMYREYVGQSIKHHTERRKASAQMATWHS